MFARWARHSGTLQSGPRALLADGAMYLCRAAAYAHRMQRLGYLVALGVIGGVIGWRVVVDREERDAAPTAEAAPVGVTKEPPHVEPPHVTDGPHVPDEPHDRDPSFTPRGEALDSVDDNWKPIKLAADRATELENLAMRAVYERCSKYAVFREGSRLNADVQFNKRWFSNVEVRLARPEVSHGNVLWYTVTLRNNRPVSFRATKDIAAKLCGLPGKDIEVDL